MNRECLKNDIDPFNLFEVLKMRYLDKKNNPYFMRTFGTCIFCGAQGYGKTLSAVQYVIKLMEKYPLAILVTNIAIANFPFNAKYKRVGDNTFIIHNNGEYINIDWLLDHNERICIEYDGLDTLKYINNAEYGVIYLIDELHLELNSLESKNIDIDVMTEISQQRKQRKHIVGTSQIYMRLAKPLREQIHDIVICRCFFGCIQYNKWVDAEHIEETDKGLKVNAKGRFLFFHSPSMYSAYDTYAKMKRYNKEWQGRKRVDNLYYGGVNQ